MIDDGSLDNCGIKCDQYAAKDLRVRVIHKKNSWTGYGQKCRIGYSTGTVRNALIQYKCILALMILFKIKR